MDAASCHRLRGRGAPCLLHHCAGLERIIGSERPSARDRLESELGCELARLLLGALAGDRRRRAAFV